MVRNLINLKNIAIVAVFSLVAFFGFNSFTSIQSATKADPSERYYFLPYSDNAGLIENPESWSDENENEESCAGTAYLCSITYDNNLYDSIEEFLEINSTKTAIENNAVTVDYKSNP